MNPLEWQSVSNPSLLRWWWFLWLCSLYLGNASFRLSQSEEIEALIFYSGFSAFVSLFDLPLSLVSISLVGKIHEMQWTWKEQHQTVL
jgi:hypothetical protein